MSTHGTPTRRSSKAGVIFYANPEFAVLILHFSPHVSISDKEAIANGLKAPVVMPPVYEEPTPPAPIKPLYSLDEDDQIISKLELVYWFVCQ